MLNCYLLFQLIINIPKSHCQVCILQPHNYMSALLQSDRPLDQSPPWFYSIFHHRVWNRENQKTIKFHAVILITACTPTTSVRFYNMLRAHLLYFLNPYVVPDEYLFTLNKLSSSYVRHLCVCLSFPNKRESWTNTQECMMYPAVQDLSSNCFKMPGCSGPAGKCV